MEIPWDRDDFIRTIDQIDSLSGYLQTDRGFRTPDYVVRHEDYENGVRGLLKWLDLPSDNVAIPKLNSSILADDLRQQILGDSVLRQMVEDYFCDDMANFGY